MDPKKRMMLVIAIAITIIAGVIASFGIPIFFQTSNIALPEMSDNSQSEEQGGDPSSVEVGNFVPINVTTETVQEVIATLHRNNCYYREVTVELFTGSDANLQGSTSTILIWNDGDYSKIATMSYDGSMKYSLMAEGKKYTWYGSERKWSTSNDDDIDLEQNLPTYEDVLTLDPKNIMRADYETKLGINCVFVECFIQELGYLERYWVSTESGLLIASETVKKESDSLIYRMSENRITSLESDSTAFTLPDGTVLHRVVGPQTEE